ncbi:TniQ family protein [Streptomyces adonidis]|uniref:TniQ family protein n=1 Tax=Streptomyces adonidis TaxID=3231367 RepID=UPI0034DB46D3
MFGSVSQFYESTWAVSLSSRFCPQCLASDGSAVQEAYGGSWNLRRHLPVVFACTIHHQLLHSRCPSCQSGLAHSYKGRATRITQPGSTHVCLITILLGRTTGSRQTPRRSRTSYTPGCSAAAPSPVARPPPETGCALY